MGDVEQDTMIDTVINCGMHLTCPFRPRMLYARRSARRELIRYHEICVSDQRSSQVQYARVDGGAEEMNGRNEKVLNNGDLRNRSEGAEQGFYLDSTRLRGARQLRLAPGQCLRSAWERLQGRISYEMRGGRPWCATVLDITSFPRINLKTCTLCRR